MKTLLSMTLLLAIGLFPCTSIAVPQASTPKPTEPLIQIKLSTTIHGLSKSERSVITNLDTKNGTLIFPSIICRPSQNGTVEIIKDYNFISQQKLPSPFRAKKVPTPKESVKTLSEGIIMHFSAKELNGKIQYDGLLSIAHRLPNQQLSAVMIPFSGTTESGQAVSLPARSPSGGKITITHTFQLISADGRPITQ